MFVVNAEIAGCIDGLSSLLQGVVQCSNSDLRGLAADRDGFMSATCMLMLLSLSSTAAKHGCDA